MISEILSKIAALLNSEGINYTVSVWAHAAGQAAGVSSPDIVRGAFGGNAVIADAAPVGIEELVDEVSECLCYAGDDGAGPGPNVTQSGRFKELLVRLTTELRLLCNSASRIERFRFKDGHPGYPVFWDFAFLVRTATGSLVFVGSSSD
jgi:hypothetical protein